MSLLSLTAVACAVIFSALTSFCLSAIMSLRWDLSAEAAGCMMVGSSVVAAFIFGVVTYIAATDGGPWFALASVVLAGPGVGFLWVSTIGVITCAGRLLERVSDR